MNFDGVSNLPGGSNECESCGKSFKQKKNLLRHLTDSQGREKRGSKCVLCRSMVTTMENYYQHLTDIHPVPTQIENIEFEKIEGELV